MANVQLPSINITPGDIDSASLPELQKIVKNLLNTTAILTEELTFLLNNLDTRNVNEIDGDVLVDGTVTAKQIAAHTITAEKMSVDELSAISANLGHITAGLIEAIQIDGSEINGGVITGSTMRTSETGSRIELNSSGFTSRDGSGRARVVLANNSESGMTGFAFKNSSERTIGQVYEYGNDLHIIAENELFLRAYGLTLIQGFIELNGTITFKGKVDFSDADVTGL